ncbi:MAG: hypothetical protein DWQ31_01745 [Planctomycetota bacterium]|nr:MAG: hypothetical protein DWQ31_01745 [Planctomycetota bacterium]REJ87187.1 MAG: hypothetical protein DWQ35_21815 [Planctomycetota bacterium]REK23849.1 MAG: hypothetical protein DWQ42_14360 [Planctomycetota bacterium]REK44716.1 MAG: hypothetical protein DWQ46_08725 [Planctomycetota bacterium]
MATVELILLGPLILLLGLGVVAAGVLACIFGGRRLRRAILAAFALIPVAVVVLGFGWFFVAEDSGSDSEAERVSRIEGVSAPAPASELVLIAAAEPVETPVEPDNDQPPVVVEDEVSGIDSTPEADLPDWVNEVPQTTGGAHYRVVTAGPYATLRECGEALDEAFSQAVAEYVDQYVPHGDRRLLSVSPGFMREHIVVAEHLGQESRSFGPLAEDQTMYTLYNLLRFDEQVQTRLAAKARQATRQSRLAYGGFGLGSLLALLTTAFAYLRIDTMTEGKYKGRLRAGATAVVASLVAGGLVLSQLVALG